MFKVQNLTTGKFLKDAISGKAMVFATMEDAEHCAAACHRDSVLSATAWNSKRGFKYAIIKA